MKLLGEVSAHCRTIFREAKMKPTPTKTAEKKEKQMIFVNKVVEEMMKPIESVNENGETEESATLFSLLFSK